MAITFPYSFTAQTTAASAEVNANFDAVSTYALNKTGDTMTGDLKFTDATYDIGKSAATRPRDLFLSRNAVIGGTLTVGGLTIGQAWPIGGVFIAVVATDPATLLGYGTWAAFGTGRTLIGIDSGQTEFDVVEETGGEKTHVLTVGELAIHNHIQDAHNHTQVAHGHNARTFASPVGGFSKYDVSISGADSTEGNGGSNIVTLTTATNVATTATNQTAGSNTAHNNLPPYIVVYFWKRTA